MSDVTTQHADYQSALPKWKLCEDAAAGEDAVKKAQEEYLPRPNPADKSLQNQERYKQYLKRAVYYNATGRTLQGLLGLAFTEPPAVEVPADMAFAEDDITGSGLPIVQHAQATLAEVLKTARAGLLVDYPVVDAQVSLADKAAGDVRATVTFYPATAITNWRTTRIAGKTVLSLVVLQETSEVVDANDFGTKCATQYRVLRFDGTTYGVEIWQQVANGADNSVLTWAPVNDYYPVRGDGTPWTEIPFQFVGAQNNDSTVDAAPLYDIATLNIAHYRNSADYEDSVYFTGQPQYWIAGLSEEWRDHLEKSGTYVGARSILPLPVGGSMGIAQAQPNTLAKEAMTDKESQMAAIGARVIQAATSIKTATQVDSEDAIAHSVLALCCSNVTSAYTQVLIWVAVFENSTGKPSFTLPTDFSSYTLDAQTLVALIQGVQTGNIPQTDLWARLRAAGIIAATKTDDQVREEIETQMPTSGPAGLGDPTEQTALPVAAKPGIEPKIAGAPPVA